MAENCYRLSSHPHRNHAQDTAQGFRPTKLRLVRPNPKVEQFEVFRLKAEHNWSARLRRALAFRDIRSCVCHKLLVSRNRAERKLPTTARL